MDLLKLMEQRIRDLEMAVIQKNVLLYGAKN